MKPKLQVAWGLVIGLTIWASGLLAAQENKTHLAIRDLASIEGVRENPLIGYGMVVGLAGTGDRRQTMFSVQTLANILQKMGVQIPGRVGEREECSGSVCYRVAAGLRPARHPNRHHRFLHRRCH